MKEEYEYSEVNRTKIIKEYIEKQHTKNGIEKP